MTKEILRKLEVAKGISRVVAAVPAQQRSQALLAMADALDLLLKTGRVRATLRT